MANKNAGTQVRFENGGTILIGADTLLNVKPGSTLNFKIPGRQPIQTSDRGVLGAVIVGNQRPCEGSLDLSYTSPIDTDGVLTAMVGALVSDKIDNAASGLVFTFSMTVKVWDTLGATTGDQYAFTGVYLDPAFDYAQGDEVDTLKCAFKCNNSGPAITRIV